MRRITIALALLTVMAFGAVTWVEDTCFRNERLDSTFSGRFKLAPGDTSRNLTLAYYPWTQLWAYALLETLTPGRGDDAAIQVQWRYGTYDAYAKTNFYWSEWAQALPSIWAWAGGGPDSMIVLDSLYLSPLYDLDVPLAWVDRVQLRAWAAVDTLATFDSVWVRLWVRRRTFTEAGPPTQWPWWFFPQ